ncbi:hypothetical protein [Tautonia sociabilis]|uniref:Uncharacterized protein n=1 Tax=Tautonia sociabilis TaxID=2080755 RepID=A0A432MLH6_9BACT|nr:hypothetical protein [Tautonia sociabilis]RUL88274.1 hypothetical protein TsocGM_08025 [Tautonia sociabilis]
MTFDECHESLVQIRRRQGTRFPKIRVDCGGEVFRGRLSRTDSDPEHRAAPIAPRGALVLEDLKHGRARSTVVPLDRIGPDGLRPLDDAE